MGQTITARKAARCRKPLIAIDFGKTDGHLARFHITQPIPGYSDYRVTGEFAVLDTGDIQLVGVAWLAPHRPGATITTAIMRATKIEPLYAEAYRQLEAIKLLERGP